VKAKFKIDGMHCDSCAVDIRETLEDTAGVKQANVDFSGKTAVVEFNDETVQQQTLIKKLQDIGYTATIASESQSGIGA